MERKGQEEREGGRPGTLWSAKEGLFAWSALKWRGDGLRPSGLLGRASSEASGLPWSGPVRAASGKALLDRTRRRAPPQPRSLGPSARRGKF